MDAGINIFKIKAGFLRIVCLGFKNKKIGLEDSKWMRESLFLEMF